MCARVPVIPHFTGAGGNNFGVLGLSQKVVETAPAGRFEYETDGSSTNRGKDPSPLCPPFPKNAGRGEFYILGRVLHNDIVQYAPQAPEEVAAAKGE